MDGEFMEQSVDSSGKTEVFLQTDRYGWTIFALVFFAIFCVSDSVFMDVLPGKFKHQGKLLFELPKSLTATVTQDSDAPGYNTDVTLFQFGSGRTY
jgi:hypothetical protein